MFHLFEQPSARAKLGSKALKYLKRGKPVDDQVIVDVLVEVIRSVAWIPPPAVSVVNLKINFHPYSCISFSANFQ